MSRESTKRKRWKDIPLGRKVLLAVGSIMLLMLGINIILYSQVNKTIRRMDTGTPEQLKANLTVQ